ncbi:hypothetical protein ACIQM4_29805 [Streptomyces sp. NPDC091272]|uniref:hypothetical protein n=1 Tax=Streptomyces sp. NPDC091272 TaxID=3365981 RepID=UPI00382AD28D
MQSSLRRRTILDRGRAPAGSTLRGACDPTPGTPLDVDTTGWSAAAPVPPPGPSVTPTGPDGG